ncbi:MAG: hypothetical protein GEU88_16700 [Solirubrobacterales bacterium]|nr:hypothetical protein [Solirubrobacterales bacterium]
MKADRLHPLIPCESPPWRDFYSVAPRQFGRLKNEWALLPLRVRGLDRVALYADLTILATLACALARAGHWPDHEVEGRGALVDLIAQTRAMFDSP